MRTIRIIEPTVLSQSSPLRVAVYCRVSTESKEQESSLKAQVAHFTHRINETSGWDFAGIYAEQESGVKTQNRNELFYRGIELRFELENLSSKDKRVRQMFTALAAIVQGESWSRSENIKWGMRHQASQGKTILNHSRFLGYTKNEDGGLVIVADEAEVVRLIYSLYLSGMGYRQIKNTGEVPQQVFENHHEAIIEPAIFEQVQQEKEKRSIQKDARDTQP